MNFDTAALLWSLLFGIIGTAYFVYGKKQKDWVTLGCGVALGLYPYVIDSVGLIVFIGIVLTATPFIYRRYFD